MISSIIYSILMILIARKLSFFSADSFQPFTDFIIEQTSLTGYNKSKELLCFWIIVTGGILFILICGTLIHFLCHHRRKISQKKSQGGSSSHGTSPSGIADASPRCCPFVSTICHILKPDTGVIFFLVAFFSYGILFGQWSFPLGASLVVSLFGAILAQKKKAFPTLSLVWLFLLSYYSVVAVATIGCFLGLEAFTLTNTSLYVASTVVFSMGVLYVVVAGRSAKGNAPVGQTPAAGISDTSVTTFAITSLLSYMQCLLPGLFFVWLIDCYEYNGEIITVRYATGYYVFFIAIILLFFAGFVAHAVAQRKGKATALLSILTPMSLFAYHSFSACPMYAQPDQHHHGEQMILWNQIFTHGQSLYETFTPVSGLFPLVNGFIQHILLDGTISDYSPGISITMVIFSFITMYLLAKHIGPSYAGFFAVLFALSSYNRQYLVLPILLLLTLPYLWQRSMGWIQVWILSCFLAGLYYPLYGAALLLGTLPMGIYQIIRYFKSHTFSTKHKKQPWFYISWLLILIPICCQIPLLFKMLTHTLTYSSQTTMADGISILSSSAPDGFLSWLSAHAFWRETLYSCYRFFLPAFGVWMLVSVMLRIFLSRMSSVGSETVAAASDASPAQKSRKITLLLYLLAGVITLMISYTYTLVRADVGVILARTDEILVAVGIFLAALLLEHVYVPTTQRQGQSLTLCSITDIHTTGDNEATTDSHAIATGDGVTVAGNAIFSPLLLSVLVALPTLLYATVADYKTPAMWVYPNGESQIVMDDAALLYTHYDVPDTFVKSEDTGLAARYQALLGDGFMVADQLTYIQSYAAIVEKCEAAVASAMAEGTLAEDYNLTFMSPEGQGFIDYLGVTCASTGYLGVARSYEAQLEIWEGIGDDLPVIFWIDTESSYYILRWMMEAGYVYSEADDCFYPPVIAALLDATDSTVATSDTTDNTAATATSDTTATTDNRTSDTSLISSHGDYRTTATALELQKSAESFGASYTTLSSVLTLQSDCDTCSLVSADATTVDVADSDVVPLDTSCTTFSGADCDVLRLTVDEALAYPAHTLTITWETADGFTSEGCVVTCEVLYGNLLLPMGMNPGWLLSDITDFTLTFTDAAGEVIYETTYASLCSTGDPYISYQLYQLRY